MEIKFRNGIKVKYTFPEAIEEEQIGEIILTLKKISSCGDIPSGLNKNPKMIIEYGTPKSLGINTLLWCKTKEGTINFIKEWKLKTYLEKFKYFEKVGLSSGTLNKRIKYYKNKYDIK